MYFTNKSTIPSREKDYNIEMNYDKPENQLTYLTVLQQQNKLLEMHSDIFEHNNGQSPKTPLLCNPR